MGFELKKRTVRHVSIGKLYIYIHKKYTINYVAVTLA